MSPNDNKSLKKIKVVKYTRKTSASGLSPQLKSKKISMLSKSKSGDDD
jgi:hypothetical protein